MKSDAGFFSTVWELIDFQNGRHEMTRMANMFILSACHHSPTSDATRVFTL